MSRYNQTVQLWQSWNVRTASDLDKFLDSFRILFAFNSGKIENQDITYNDTREIFEKGQVTGYTGSPRTLFEQQNQKLCYELLKEKFTLREPLSVELVKELHAVLTDNKKRLALASLFLFGVTHAGYAQPSFNFSGKQIS